MNYGATLGAVIVDAKVVDYARLTKRVHTLIDGCGINKIAFTYETAKLL